MPQLRSRLPSPLGPRRAGASRQRAPGPPGRVYKPPRPPASERASERASEERALSEGEGKRPVLGPHSHAVCELGRPDSASAARRGIGVPGPARPPASPPAPGSGRGGSTASQPASQPASQRVFPPCVCAEKAPARLGFPGALLQSRDVCVDVVWGVGGGAFLPCVWAP